MEVLSIIPVRGGSKGIPGKNIKLLAGKPLVAYTIEASLKSKYITRTVVSTEDTKIKSVSESFGKSKGSGYVEAEYAAADSQCRNAISNLQPD